jgi:alpha-galactosidase
MKQLRLASLLAVAATAMDNGVGVLPVMGWSGYNALMQSSGECAGDFYNETAFLQSADVLLSSGLAAKGYVYLNADDCYLAYSRTPAGLLAADATRFPHGMAWLADQLHARGLKLGLYAAASLLTCRSYPGSQEHIELDAATFASWGADFTKLDSCVCPNCTSVNNSLANGTHSWAAQHIAWSHALNRTGRPVVFMCSWAAYYDVCADMQSPSECGPVPWDYSPNIAEVCNQFRYDWDLFPTWSRPLPHPGGIREVLEYTATSSLVDKLRPLTAPGAALDLDFLVVGCPTDANCEPFSPNPLAPLSDAEQQTQMSMWCVLGAPLVIGSDVRRLSPRALATLGNEAAIAIDQDALRAPPRLLTLAQPPAGGRAWARPMANGDVALALLNVGDDTAASFTVPLADLGLGAGAFAYDVWARTNESVAVAVQAAVPPHETVLLRLTPAARASDS